jgi:membrane protease YdiL (CAAX protease family)
MTRSNRSLAAFLVLVTVLSGGYVAAMLLAGKAGAYLAQGYMLLPAVAALLTRACFDENGFRDVNLRLGRLRHYFLFWLMSLGIAGLFFLAYWAVGAGTWDFTGTSFLTRLTKQFEESGQDINQTLPPGMMPRDMLWLFFVGRLTVFNILPGLITGFGEEFGWRGLMLMRLYAVRPWAAFVVGGLIWYAWPLPLGLVAPQKLETREALLLLVPMAVGGICAHTYLTYVYVKSRSVFVAAVAHITMNNASASFSYLFVLREQGGQFLANLATALVMVAVALLLYATGQLRVFRTLAEEEAPK